MALNLRRSVKSFLIVASFAEILVIFHSQPHTRPILYMLMFGVEEFAGAVKIIILQMQTFKVKGEKIEEVGALAVLAALAKLSIG